MLDWVDCYTLAFSVRVDLAQVEVNVAQVSSTVVGTVADEQAAHREARSRLRRAMAGRAPEGGEVSVAYLPIRRRVVSVHAPEGQVGVVPELGPTSEAPSQDAANQHASQPPPPPPPASPPPSSPPCSPPGTDDEHDNRPETDVASGGGSGGTSGGKTDDADDDDVRLALALSMREREEAPIKSGGTSARKLRKIPSQEPTKDACANAAVGEQAYTQLSDEANDKYYHLAQERVLSAYASSADAASGHASKKRPPHLGAHLFKHYPGQEQVELSVKVHIPGSWFSTGGEGQLSASLCREKYAAVAVEFDGAHVFQPALGRQPAKVGAAIRFLCPSHAAVDAEHQGYWIELPVWNRFRNDTYKDRRHDEVRRATLTIRLPRSAQPRCTPC